MLSKILQESFGHASCGFQLHGHKQPPKCKMVDCASAERISPHQSCPASAGSLSQGSALSASRNVTLEREEKNVHTDKYEPPPKSGKLSLRKCVYLFSCMLSTLSPSSPSESRASQWRHQSVSASLFSAGPISSEVCVNSCNLNVLLESGSSEFPSWFWRCPSNRSSKHYVAVRGWRSIFHIWGRGN